jgi:hypothetical protein
MPVWGTAAAGLTLINHKIHTEKIRRQVWKMGAAAACSGWIGGGHKKINVNFFKKLLHSSLRCVKLI